MQRMPATVKCTRVARKRLATRQCGPRGRAREASQLPLKLTILAWSDSPLRDYHKLDPVAVESLADVGGNVSPFVVDFFLHVLWTEWSPRRFQESLRLFSVCVPEERRGAATGL